MILVVDSGSTKTDWIALDQNGKEIFSTQTFGVLVLRKKSGKLGKYRNFSALRTLGGDVEKFVHFRSWNIRSTGMKQFQHLKNDIRAAHAWEVHMV